MNGKDLQSELQKSHPTWKIPERRVNKFLKRHLNSNGSGTVGSSTGGGGGGTGTSSRFLRFFQNAKPTTVPKPIQKVQAPIAEQRPKEDHRLVVEKEKPSEPEKEPEIVPVSVPKPKPDPISTPVVETKPVDPEIVNHQEVVSPVGGSRDLAQVYSDDNDDRRNECSCEACIVM